MHLPRLEVGPLLLLTLLARLLALLGWQWAVPRKVTKLSTVVARKQIGGASPAAAPTPSAHSAEEQEA